MFQAMGCLLGLVLRWTRSQVAQRHPGHFRLLVPVGFFIGDRLTLSEFGNDIDRRVAGGAVLEVHYDLRPGLTADGIDW